MAEVIKIKLKTNSKQCVIHFSSLNLPKAIKN